MLYRNIFFIRKKEKKVKKEFSDASAFRSSLKQFQHAKSSDFFFFFMKVTTHLHISIWGWFGLNLLQVDSEWALYPKFMENGFFWLRSSAKSLHYCNHWAQYFSPPLSPGQAAGNSGYHGNPLLERGWVLRTGAHLSRPGVCSQTDFHAWFYFQISLHLCSPYSPSGIISLGLQVSHHFSSSSLSVHSNPSLKLKSSRKFILLHCHL